MFASLVDALQGPAEQAVDDSASDEDIQGPAEGLQAPPQQSESAAQEPEVLISSPSAPEEETPAAAVASGLQSADDLAEEESQIPVTQPEASRTSVPTAAAQRPQQAFSLWGMASALADNVRKNTADIASSVRDTDWKAELEAFKKGVSEDSQVVQQQTAKAIQEGRTKLEHLQAQQAQRRPPHLPRVSPEQLQQLNQVGSRLGKFGATFVSSTRSLFDHVQEGIQQELDGVEDYLAGKGSKAAANSRAASRSSSRAAAGQRYSRLDSEVSAMQRNSATYCDEPQDTADYQAWLQGFDLGSRKGEIEAITGGNAFMAELQSRIVPLIVEYEAFWTRYFFQLHKLQVKHAQRQEVAQRAQRAAAEELAWDDEEPSAQPKGKAEVKRIGSGASPPARHQPKEESELQSTAAVAASVTAAPPLAAAAVVADAAVSEESSPMSVKVAKQGGEDEGLETSTASDDSGQGPWTVVTSPTHARTPSDEVTSPRPRHAATEAAPSCAAAELSTSLQAAAVEEEPAPQAATDQPAKSAGTNAGAEVTKMRRPVDGQAGTGDEDDDLDISDDDGAVAAAGGAESEVDEDWGSWE